ncbi:TPA: hypothetical protein EYG96_01915 [Candidatus Gracilibacteria bacterium]|nr:hypothetical protein [Candidatus Peregrinibacteria bacterium]HIQ56779.1 hypothetical protein [Candidatus Gracilibacteria bacterium]
MKYIIITLSILFISACSNAGVSKEQEELNYFYSSFKARNNSDEKIKEIITRNKPTLLKYWDTRIVNRKVYQETVAQKKIFNNSNFKIDLEEIINNSKNDILNNEKEYILKKTEEVIEKKKCSIHSCIFNNKCIILPKNGHCVENVLNHAWKCEKGYIDTGTNCVLPSEKIQNTCNAYVKGNVSFNTGAKIYHIPGCENYYDVKINSAYGERYFCSEQAARNAGWRKAWNCP